MAIETGIARQLRLKRQSAKGTISGTSGGWIQRRTDFKLKFNREAYTTEEEKVSHQQLTSNRLGVKLIDAMISGIWSPGTYSDVLSAVLRRDFAAVTSITGASITIAGSGPTYTVTRAAGSFLTDGIKIGAVVRLSVGSFNAANLNKNLWVTAVTALVLTVMPVNGVALVAEGPIATSTVSVPGKVTYVPATGHTSIYYTGEDWSPSVPASEVAQDIRFISGEIGIPGSGNATINVTGSGLDQLTPSASVYFSAPTAETTTEPVQAASGILYFNGVAQAAVTDLKITLDGKPQPADGTVGGNVRADVFRGKLVVRGSFSAYFDSLTLQNLFVGETVASLATVIANGSSAAADFCALALPRLDLTETDRDDSETGQKRTYSFVAEFNSAGGTGISTEQTTIWVQDSQAA